ncbi:hypothetical protein MJL81_31700, partial [Salmonella enterica subsp. enterica serovar Anatum]|nr:hypothetical protein [Salmonella enterica subsp. enterica serovar Anatum]
HKVVVEQGIKGREIECAVLGNDNPQASTCGEIVLNSEFYAYDIEVNKLPAGFNIYGDWKYSNGTVLAVPVDYQAKAETTRQKLL